MRIRSILFAVCVPCGLFFLVLLCPVPAGADEGAAAAKDDKNAADAGDREIVFADGQMKMQAPEAWRRVKPRSQIIEYEFSIPASQGDAKAGRMTTMAAGGSVKANIDRWIGQFSQPDGGSTRKLAKIEKHERAGHPVHMVAMSGTFSDRRGPFAPAVERPKYRMLAAIVEIEKGGKYFVKFYGPQQTVADHEKAFRAMIESMKKK